MSNEIKVMYGIKLEIGVSLIAGVWTYAELKAGIENIAEAMNYVIHKYQFMANSGWGSTHVTGAHPEWTLTGKRIFGDTAQDYIFGLKNTFGSSRETNLRLTVVDSSSGSAVTKQLLQPVTIADMQEWSGATTDHSAINIVLSCNGAPAEANTAPLPALSVVSVASETPGDTAVYVNPIKTVQTNTYRYKVGTSISLPTLGASCSTWGDGSYTPGTDITATTGNSIGIIEVSSAGLAVRGGVAIVTSA